MINLTHKLPFYFVKRNEKKLKNPIKSHRDGESVYASLER